MNQGWYEPRVKWMTPSIPNTAYLWPSHSLSVGEARRENVSGEHAVSAAPTQKHLKRTAAALLEGHGRLYKEVRGTVSLTRGDLCWPANQGVGCPCPSVPLESAVPLAEDSTRADDVSLWSLGALDRAALDVAVCPSSALELINTSLSWRSDYDDDYVTNIRLYWLSSSVRITLRFLDLMPLRLL